MAVDVLSKNEYVKRVRTKTYGWISRLALLHTVAGEAGVTARIKGELRIADFREALEGFQAKMEQIEETDDVKWGEQRADAENALTALEESFDGVCGDIKKMTDDISCVDEGEEEWDH